MSYNKWKTETTGVYSGIDVVKSKVIDLVVESDSKNDFRIMKIIVTRDEEATPFATGIVPVKVEFEFEIEVEG